MVSAKRPLKSAGELFRTDAKCTDDKVVLAGWEIQTGRWFKLHLTALDAPFLFKEGKGSQWASTSSELLATPVALVVFGYVDEKKQRRAVEVTLMAGTDNSANEFFDSEQGHHQVASHGNQHAVEFPGCRDQR